MKDNELFFAKVKPDAKVPTKNREDAGYDIYACFEDDFIVIPFHSTVMVPTGIASAISPKYYIQIEERGSTGAKGIKKSAGVIDSSYRGEWFIAITNTTDKDLVISKLDRKDLCELMKYSNQAYRGTITDNYGREALLSFDNEEEGIIYPYSKAIAQAVVHEVPVIEVKEITYDELTQISSHRGTGKLGSSGK